MPIACALGIFSGITILYFVGLENLQIFQTDFFTREEFFRDNFYACPCTRARICFSTFCTSSWNIRADTRSAP